MANKELSDYSEIDIIDSTVELVALKDGVNVNAAASVLKQFIDKQIDDSGLPADVENLKEGQATSAIYATDWDSGGSLSLSALTPAYAGQGAFVPDSDSGTHTDGVTGAVVQNSGIYTSVIVSGALTWKWLSENVLSKKADKKELEKVSGVSVDSLTRVKSISSGISIYHRPEYVRADTDTYFTSADGHYLWAFGAECGTSLDINPGASLDFVSVKLGLSSSHSRVNFTVYKRPTSADTYTTMPGQGANDVSVYSCTYALTDLGAVLSADFQELAFQFPPMTAVAGYSYLFQWEFFDEDGEHVGTGITNLPKGSLNAEQQGYYELGALSASSTAAVAWKLGNVGYAEVDQVGKTNLVVNELEWAFQSQAFRGLPTSTYPESGGHYMFAVGVQCGVGQDIAIGREIDTFRVGLEIDSEIDWLRLDVYKRPTDSSTYSTAPGQGANDVLLSSHTYSTADLGLAAAVGSVQKADLMFSPITVADGYTYLFKLRGYTHAWELAEFGIANRPAGTLNSQQRGFYDTGAVLGGTSAIVWELGKRVPAVAYETATLDLRADTVQRSFTEQFVPWASRNNITARYKQADGHYSFAVGVEVGTDIAAGLSIDSVQFDLELGEDVDGLELRIYKRPTDSATSSVVPGKAANDVLIYQHVLSVDYLGLTAESGYTQTVDFPFDEFTTEAGYTYIFGIYGHDSDKGYASIGIASAPGTAYTGARKGFYDDLAVLAGSNCIAWSLGTSTYAASSGSAGADPRDFVSTASASASGYNVTLTGAISRAGSLLQFSGSAALTAPSSGNVTGESRTLTSRQGSLPPLNYYNPDGALAHSNVSAVVVKDASTSAVLVLGTDYALEPVNGYVGLQTTGDSRAVTVDYHWSQLRYDLICVDAETLAISVVAGTERRTDAGEFLPKPSSSSQIPLYYARVADGVTTELVPVWYLDGLVSRDVVQARRNDHENQRRALDPILKMARAGKTIKVAAMGDSIGAQGIVGTQSLTEANGQNRDRVEYFTAMDCIGSDVAAAVTTYDTGDGYGQVHTESSHLWGFIHALESLGATVEFYNFCVGGTNSYNTDNGGKSTELRNAVWSVAPDILLCNYGQNELGNSATESALTDLFSAAVSNGVKCILAMGVTRPGELKNIAISTLRDKWRATRRAAEFTRNSDGDVCGAYWPVEYLVDDEYLGAMGVAPKELGAEDKYHHPGVHEYNVYARDVMEMIIGR